MDAQKNHIIHNKWISQHKNTKINDHNAKRHVELSNSSGLTHEDPGIISVIDQEFLERFPFGKEHYIYYL